MEKIYKIAIAICLAISILLFPVSVLLTATGLILTGTLAMVIHITESAGEAIDRPVLFVFLGEDGRSFVIRNIGNAAASEIHVSVVPSNLEYIIDRIDADGEEKTECGQLIGKNRVIIEYADETGKRYSKSEDLRFEDDCEYDPTKPMIPIFK
jgi:hypothetical protein